MASKMLAIDCYSHGRLDLDLAEMYARQELGNRLDDPSFNPKLLEILCYNAGMTEKEARRLSIRLFGSDKIGGWHESN